MTLQLKNEDQMLQEELMGSCKKIIGKNLKAVILFGSRASGTAKKYSDYDILIIADDLPLDWRRRDTIILELDKHGIFDILLYTGEELEKAIMAVNPLIMNIFDRPHKILYGKSFISRKARLYTDEIIQRHILRLGKNTWKIAGGINV
ncbi:DNA polymerase beta domain protein region [groundwater metagenome]